MVEKIAFHLVVATVGCLCVSVLSGYVGSVCTGYFAYLDSLFSEGLVDDFHDFCVYCFYSVWAYAFVEPVPECLVAWFILEA